jgi:ribose-phosphate pyrophosphokinase
MAIPYLREDQAMEIKILSGTANLSLAEKIAGHLGVPLARRTAERFPDSELHIELEESVRGHDVYIVQPTCPPVDAHLFELLMMADACRRAGAGRLTAIIPYFGYARQDRRARGREPVGVRMVADLISTGGFRRVVGIDFHSQAVESAFAIPVEPLSAVSMLAWAARASIDSNAVIVSPDLGAVKLAERYAKVLDLPVAIIHKTRLSGEKVKVQRIVGEVCEKNILVIDDMITTGGTIEKAIQAVLDAGCSPDRIKVMATHGLFVGPAAERLGKLPIEKIYVSDSVPPPEAFPVPLEILSLAGLLAETTQRLHKNQSIGGLIGDP